jgi:hypothetical protein
MRGAIILHLLLLHPHKKVLLVLQLLIRLHLLLLHLLDSYLFCILFRGTLKLRWTRVAKHHVLVTLLWQPLLTPFGLLILFVISFELTFNLCIDELEESLLSKLVVEVV